MSKPTTIPGDAELLERMASGDEAAFEMLYDRRQAGVYKFALRMSGSASVAEDVTQDVFLALIREGGNYDPSRGAVSAYLLGMARFRVLHRLERDRAFVSLDSTQEETEHGFEEPPAQAADPLAQLTRNETIEAVRQAVLALPTHYREVVVLCNLHEMSYEEAAQVLDCAVGTVRSRLNRARAMLLQKLGRTAGDDASATGTNSLRKTV